MLAAFLLLCCAHPVATPEASAATGPVQREPAAPRDARAWFLTAQVAEQRGELETAAEALRWVTLLDGQRAWSWLELGGFHERQGADEQAVAAYRTAVQRAPEDPEALDALAAAYYRAGMHDQAVQTWERAQALSPDPARAARLQESP